MKELVASDFHQDKIETYPSVHPVQLEEILVQKPNMLLKYTVAGGVIFLGKMHIKIGHPSKI